MLLFRRRSFRSALSKNSRLLSLQPLEGRLVPTTFTVTNLNDSGAGSLRDCLSQADANPGTDTVVFNSGLSGTITLATELIVTGSVTIDGPGALTIGLTSDGNNRILSNVIGSKPTIVIQDLSLFGGVAGDIFPNQDDGLGGAIGMTGGTLIVDSCFLTNNQAIASGGAIYALNTTVELRNTILTGNEARYAGGIYLGGLAGLTIDACRISGNTATETGGGIGLFNYLVKSVIRDSIISDNHAEMGGGIFSLGALGASLEILNSTISTNSALVSGGGAALGYFAGLDSTTTIRNSTISGNSSGKAGAGVLTYSPYSTLIVENSTVANNQTLNPANNGAFQCYGKLTLTSSIVTNNSNSGGSTFPIMMNFSAVDPFAGFIFTGSNNITSGIDLKLGPLANNGGTTKTHLPANDSPVRGKGSNPAGLTTDQRGTGFFRDINGAPDMGAIEVASEFIVRSALDSGPGTLRAQVVDANRTAGAQTITFDNSFSSPQTITLTSGEIAINEALTISGKGSLLTTIDGANSGRIFNASAAGDFTPITISNLSLTKGKAASGGAILISDQTLNITYCRFIDNQATFDGGAISVTAPAGAAKVNIDNTTFTGNKAEDGGALHIGNNAVIKIETSTFNGNSAADGGGAIFFDNLFSPFQSFVVTNCTISNNSAARNGAIFLNNNAGIAFINNSTIYQNSATLVGSAGGIGQTGSMGTIDLYSSIVSGNVNASAPDLFSAGTVVADFSAIGSSTGATITGGNNLAYGLDLKLGILQNNGGVTHTHLPANDSPVVNAGANGNSLTNDQRGPMFGRDRNGVDIGAVEAKTDFVVTNALDSGPGSLRQAAVDANAFAGFDNITFSASFFKSATTITLTTGEIALGESVNIIGPGASIVTINANNASLIFNTLTSVSQTINLFGLTLTGGNSGAIFGFEDVISLTNCVITGNKTAGSGGAIRLTGAAIYGAALNLTGTTISGNTAALTGGGIYLSGQVSVNISKSTLSGNMATGRGGALYFFGGIGTGGFTIRNSTISGNKSDSNGGGLAFTGSGATAGNVIIQNSTITNNTGGLNLGGGISQTSGNTVINLESSIVFGNSAGATPDIFAANKVNAKTSALGLHLGFAINDLGGNLTPGTNPLLGTLANNGGPTQTHAIALNSPALNKGSNPTSLTTDQRGTGFARVQLGGIDIGSYEAALIVDTTVDENDGDYSKGDLSLREAIVLGNSFNNSADTISFDPVVFAAPQTITLTMGELGGGRTIVGPAIKVTINANNASRVFNLSAAGSGSQNHLSNLILTGGNAGSGNGGAIFGSQFTTPNLNVTLNNCTITGNTAGNGGGIYIQRGKLTIDGCSIINNTATTSAGGGVASPWTVSKTTIRRSNISGNTANSGGGGLSIYGGTYQGGYCVIEDCTISNNSVTQEGGGLNLRGNANTIRNSTISGNTAGRGGGIALTIGGTAIIQNSTIVHNIATEPSNAGGGISASVALPLIFLESSIVSKNSGANAPDIWAAGAVTHKNSSIFSSAGIASLIDQGGNRPFGEDALLGPLANNGGPTLTHALLPGSPLIDKGTNPASVLYDQRGTGFVRDHNGVADIGAFEWHPAPIQPAYPQLVTINDGSAQRSRVTSLTITFSNLPTLPPTPASAFELKRNSDGAIVNLAIASMGNGVTLTFSGGAVEFGSLADGRYTLRILAAQIPNLDGDNNGTVGDDFEIVGDKTNKLFRLFGDADGNGVVTASDFNAFRLGYGTTGASIFDFDNNNAVTASDFNQFRTKYGVSI